METTKGDLYGLRFRTRATSDARTAGFSNDLSDQGHCLSRIDALNGRSPFRGRCDQSHERASGHCTVPRDSDARAGCDRSVGEGVTPPPAHDRGLQLFFESASRIQLFDGQYSGTMPTIRSSIPISDSKFGSHSEIQIGAIPCQSINDGCPAVK
jgi:hypothetical protein